MDNDKVYAIRANGDRVLTFGSFTSFAKAVWYGDSEFGPGTYSIVVL